MDSNHYELGIYLVIYQHYSTFTLCITWALFPLVFYIILTQSKSLGPIKWLFLNQSFWCLMLETLVGIVKPVLLGEVAAGYSGGFFKANDFRYSAITGLLCLLFIYLSLHGLTITILNRYATLFDVKFLTKFAKLKSIIITAAILHLCVGILCFISVLPRMFIDARQIHKWAMEYDAQLVQFFNEPTFFVIPHEITDAPTMIAMILVIVANVLCIISGVTFMVSLKSMKTKTALDKKLQRSVLLSVIVQILLTIVFLFLPVFMFFFYMTFKIQYSGRSMQIFMCMMTSHCFLDYISTLYFVLPYKKFIMNQLSSVSKLSKIFTRVKYKNNQIIQIQSIA